MAYFNELPNLEVISRFVNTETNEDFIRIKNLWRRAKLREDIANAVTAFNYYQIKDNERPDQIAKNYYGDPELDWVVLITNNIINLNEDWPLDNDTLYNYLIDKYGSEEALQEIHHTETIENRDSFNRIVIPESLVVDNAELEENSITTSLAENRLNSFITGDNQTEISVNLLQFIKITKKQEEDVIQSIVDIQEETSFLNVYARDNEVLKIQIDNYLEEAWPSGWGGELPVYGREQNKQILIEDKLNTDLGLTTRININDNFYELDSILENNELIPIIRLKYSKK